MLHKHRLGLLFSSLGGPLLLAPCFSWLHHDIVVSASQELCEVLTQLLSPSVLSLGFIFDYFVFQFRCLTKTEALIIDVVILLPCLIKHHFLRRAKVALVEESHLL